MMSAETLSPAELREAMDAATAAGDGAEGHAAEEASAEASLRHPLQAMPAFLRLHQVTDLIGWTRSTIYEMCDGGLLHYVELPGRRLNRRLITRASVALYLLRHANYDASQLGSLLRLVVPSLDRKGLRELQAAVSAELRRGEGAGS
jgi:hypothetical protein